MTVFIIPILIKVSAGALTRGATTAIGRWAGGSVAKKYIATVVAKKAISEGQKMALGQSQRWQSAFREDPAEAMRGAAASFISDESRDVIGQKSEISRELVTSFREKAIEEVGKEIVRRTERRNQSTGDTIIEFDRDAVADRTTEAIISRGLALSAQSSEETSTTPLNGALNGTYDTVNKGRSLATYAKNPINREEMIRASGRAAYYESFDEKALNYTIVGPDDLFQAKVRSPLEAITEKVFDISEPVSL